MTLNKLGEGLEQTGEMAPGMSGDRLPGRGAELEAGV